MIDKRRETVMLAGKYRGQKVTGWNVSEKYDGVRAWWDGGVSRGRRVRDIPWANKMRKGTEGLERKSTGLWSRYNNVLCAPDWWIDKLKEGWILDGELWCGRNTFQETMSIVRRTVNPVSWDKVQYKIFDLPSAHAMFSSGKIKNLNCELTIKGPDCDKFCGGLKSLRGWSGTGLSEQLGEMDGGVKSWCLDDPDMLDDYIESLVLDDGEGVILRSPFLVWNPKRSKMLLKVKGVLRDVGTVIGWEPGKGKLSGMMGSLRLRLRDVVFCVGGFNERERVLEGGWPVDFAEGSEVEYKYRRLSEDLVPIEARYLRRVT